MSLVESVEKATTKTFAEGLFQRYGVVLGGVLCEERIEDGRDVVVLEFSYP